MSEVVNILASGVIALLALPWIVFVLSWSITLGHWENEGYRQPAVLLSLAMAALGALIFFTKGA